MAQWGILLVVSVLISGLFELTGLPAALLLGAIISAIMVEACGGTLRVPRLFYYGAQVVIGCLVARMITPAIIGTFLQQWPLLLGVVLAIIGASSLLGWLLSKWKIFCGTTAVWGLSPGAASVMMLMAGAYGADMRLVAFMQYLRVVLVVIAASLIARFVVHIQGHATVPVTWFPAMHWLPFLETIALGIIGGILGKISRIPAGLLLVPMIAGTILHGTGHLEIELPPWLLALSYTFLGWSIGTGFTREILVHALRTLPQTVAAILVVMLFCAGLAFILVEAAGIDWLTAYLATSPGGMDSAAIIAASSKVDLSFVMALQTVRFMCVLLLGPSVSRFVADRVGSREKEPTANDPASAALVARIKQDEDELD